MSKKEKPTVIQQLNKDLGISIQAFECPKCGSTLQIDPNKIQTFCQYCGSPLPKAEELFKLSYDSLQKSKQHDLERMRIETDAYKETLQSKAQSHRSIVETMEQVKHILGIILGIIVAGIVIYMWASIYGRRR